MHAKQVIGANQSKDWRCVSSPTAQSSDKGEQQTQSRVNALTRSQNHVNNRGDRQGYMHFPVQGD
jgi:hypothetical protein